MIFRSSAFVKILIIGLLMGFVFSVNAQGGQTTTFHAKTGALTYIGGTAGNWISEPAARTTGLTPQQQANVYLRTYGPQFGVSSVSTDLALSTVKNLGNRASLRYDQVYNGVPVYGAQIVVNVAATGELLSMSGEVSPNLVMSTTAQVSADVAQQTALNAIASRQQVSINELSASAATLAIFDARLLELNANDATLTYLVEVSHAWLPIREMVIVDANTGVVTLHFNQIDDTLSSAGATWVANTVTDRAPGDPGEVDLSTYDSENTSSKQLTLLCTEADGTGPTACTGGVDLDADSAHTETAGFYDFLWTTHDRNSLDDAGFELISNVHYSSGYCNAFWDGAQMTYGDGCPSSIVVDDVVAHELTHGFTEFTSNLIYFNQSGAINESLSDVWGEFYDLQNGPETVPPNGGDYRWRLGEELDFGSPAGPGIRDMRDPNLFGDPGAMNDGYFHHQSWDGQGVHINSGINNKAAYLLVDGGSYSGVQVGAIGLEKAAAIYYEAQTNHLGPASGYQALYDILYGACNILIGGAEGINSNDCENVRLATMATQMNQEPALPGIVADMCPANHVVGEVVWQDDFETSYTYNTQTVEGTSAWQFFYDVSGSGDQFGLWTPNSGQTNDSRIFNVTPVTLPDNAYLRFDHFFGFEYGWDGGIVEYSVDAGANWTDLNSLYSGGLGYNITAFPNTSTNLAGLPVFGGRVGQSSSRYDLSTLAGSDFHAGFRIAEDFCCTEDNTGWFIDNLMIYTCELNAVVNPGFETNINAIDAGWSENSSDPKDRTKCDKPWKGKIFSFSDECAYRFKGSPGESASSIKQKWTADIPFVANDTLDVYMMARSNTLGGKMKFVVKYPDNTKKKINAPIVDTSNNWHQIGGQITLAQDPVKLVLKVKLRGDTGKMYVDDAFVGYGEVPLVASAPEAEALPLPEAPDGFRR